MHCTLQADFKEEMTFMGALVQIGGHRNIVGVAGFVQNANQPLLLLEYCAFGSLKAVLVELNRCLVSNPTALQNKALWLGQSRRFMHSGP